MPSHGPAPQGFINVVELGDVLYLRKVRTGNNRSLTECSYAKVVAIGTQTIASSQSPSMRHKRACPFLARPCEL